MSWGSRRELRARQESCCAIQITAGCNTNHCGLPHNYVAVRVAIQITASRHTNHCGVYQWSHMEVAAKPKGWGPWNCGFEVIATLPYNSLPPCHAIHCHPATQFTASPATIHWQAAIRVRSTARAIRVSKGDIIFMRIVQNLMHRAVSSPRPREAQTVSLTR